jgi:hypothetical protein
MAIKTCPQCGSVHYKHFVPIFATTEQMQAMMLRVINSTWQFTYKCTCGWVGIEQELIDTDRRCGVERRKTDGLAL